MGNIILISSPKGGTGKSAIARHLLVSAQQAGLRVVGVDFDPQASFKKWAEERESQRGDQMSHLIPTTVHAGNLKRWRDGFNLAADADLGIVDTPPNVESYLGEIGHLSDNAKLVLVPCGCTHDDFQSVKPWMQALGKRGAKAVIVMNKANRRVLSFQKYRSKLLEVGDVCPIELPNLEDFHSLSELGLTLLDVNKSRGKTAANDLWQFVSRAAGIPAA
jgi:chromosome partitioning protein